MPSKCRTIILRAEQVAAIRAGATQVRVPVKLPKWAASSAVWDSKLNRLEAEREHGGVYVWHEVPCRFRVGSVLAVREPWCIEYKDGVPLARPKDGEYEVLYAADPRDVDVIAADDDGFQKFNNDGTEASPWRSAATMPAWATRTWLTVTEVRAHRVDDITEAEALACGFRPEPMGTICDDDHPDVKALAKALGPGNWTAKAMHGFDFMERFGAKALAANPWEWVLTVAASTEGPAK